MARNTQPPEGDPVVPADEPTPPGIAGPDSTDLEELTVTELEQEAAARGATVDEGSGKDGGVVKADLVDAVADTPPPPVGRPPLILVAQSAVVIPTPVED